MRTAVFNYNKLQMSICGILLALGILVPSNGFAAELVNLTISVPETGKDELIQYQIPDNPGEEKMPLIVAYHGYGHSAASVASQSLIDEEANERGWAYLSPTGIDDKLFGSPISQKNIDAAIQWMLDNFNIDRNRIYMVGWSTGVVPNYAARHLDPDGIMIAAAGIVGGSYDLVLSYKYGTPLIQQVLENPFNFGGSPLDVPFNYYQASTVIFEENGSVLTPVPELSMGFNLTLVPFYVTWDIEDIVSYEGFQQNINFFNFLRSLEATVKSAPVSGTVNLITGEPQPHSWNVLNVNDFFDFVSPYYANRYSRNFNVQLDQSGKVSFTHILQRTPGAFSFINASTKNLNLGEVHLLNVKNVKNVSEVTIFADKAAINPSVNLITLWVESADADGFTLKLAGLQEPESIYDRRTGQFVDYTFDDTIDPPELILDLSGFQKANFYISFLSD